MPRDTDTCPVCHHPDLRAIDILLFQGYDEHTVLNVLRDIEGLPKAKDLKSHARLGHQKMDKMAVVSVLTGVIRHCHKIQTDAENARKNGHLWEYRSRSTTAMKTEMKAIELIARIEHLITDNRPTDSNVIEEVFKADDTLLDRIIQNRLEQRGQKIVDVTPAPSALARVSPPIEDVETVAPEANANGAHG
jgi:hypothetical protein